jgi:hypothetical protein
MVNSHYFQHGIHGVDKPFKQMVNLYHVEYEDGFPSPFTLIKNGLLAPL